jgi:hypothetical protein
MNKKIFFSLLGIVLLISCKKTDITTPVTDSIETATDLNEDPLPSWNDGTLKSDIIAYVNKVTKEGSPDFIPQESRIATFDNDGTLWSEKPLVQELFAFYRVQKMVAENPELAKKQPFKAVIEKDKAYFEKGGEKAIIALVIATHTGTTEDVFESDVKDFLALVKIPGKNVPLKQIRYQPQLELLEYLRANDFKTFIVTGGTIELVRGISADFYGIPKEQVVGTSFKYKFDDTNRTILREPNLDLFNDKKAKPVGIQLHIGQRPVFACGNVGAGGDIAMLEYCQSNKYSSFQLLVNHNDSIREFSYPEKDNTSLDAIAKNKWHVVDMKTDWKTIFADK